MAEVVIKTKTVFFDEEDRHLIEKYKWQFNSYGYLVTNSKDFKGPTTSFHRLIMGDIPQGMLIDHINQNILDNRKANLRVCTKAQNGMNRKKTKLNKSGFKGVSYQKDKKLYRAVLMLNQKQIFLGCFKTAIEAAKAYNEGALKYFGEFAYLNEVA